MKISVTFPYNRCISPQLRGMLGDLGKPYWDHGRCMTDLPSGCLRKSKTNHTVWIIELTGSMNSDGVRGNILVDYDSPQLACCPRIRTPLGYLVGHATQPTLFDEYWMPESIKLAKKIVSNITRSRYPMWHSRDFLLNGWNPRNGTIA